MPEPSAASFRIAALARASADDGADVTVLTSTAPRGAGTAAPVRGVRVRRAPVLRDVAGAIRGYIPYLSFDLPVFFRMLFSRADVFVAEAPPTTGLVALVAARLRRRPLVYYPGDVWTDGVISMGAPDAVVGVMRAVERRVLRGARTILSVSPEVTERLVAIGADPARIVLVGNGIDTDTFMPSVAAPEVERPYFVYAGTMSEWQRPEAFVEALAQVEDVDLRFFGGGTSLPAIEAAAARLTPGRVHIGGVVSPAESAAWMRGAVAALVSIVPGIGYDFARPTKTYAAAAVGTPVLYAGAETGGRIVTDAGLGEAVALDAAEIADAMRRLLASRDDAERSREARSSWAKANVSLAGVGRRAAEAVAAVARRR
ncbi:glycosyltransferase family 4 protein [Microbacterium aoyamense]|uniref:D-inositol 3-phosphate glycosyltransferase n=1 Tax=Microbacterium aoyamense TaxID=344166 RepID=A0ABN2PN85_9MICO